MGMFDYCTFKLHDINGKETLSFSGQTNIDSMLCHYNITEHGMFVRGLRRMRHDTISMILDDSDEYIWITFNWYGAVSKIVVKRDIYGSKEMFEKEIPIPKKVLHKWNMDNLKCDLKINPQLFKIKTNYFQRLYYYIMFNYSEVRFFFKYDIKEWWKNRHWRKEHKAWAKKRKAEEKKK